MISELNAATTPDERLHVAFNYIRSCLAGSNVSVVAKEDVVATLIEKGDNIIKQRLGPQNGGTS